MVRMNINLLEVSDRRLENLDMRKPYGNIIREGNPEVAASLGSLQNFAGGRLREYGFRGVPREEPGRSEFDR